MVAIQMVYRQERTNKLFVTEEIKNRRKLVKRVVSIKAVLFGVWAVLAASPLNAEEGSRPVSVMAEDVVTGVTNSLLSFAKEKSDLLAKDPEVYFSGVKDILDPAVDFLGIAKNVMGKRHWLAASEEQREQFVLSFADSLVRTYGKGMANFADFDVTVESSQASESSDKIYYVVQAVKTGDGTSKVVYTMKLVENRWQLRNVVLNGINMGKSFHSQFSQLVKDNGGDIGLAVAKWGQEQV